MPYQNKQLPNISSKEMEILKLLFKFRILNTNHFRNVFHYTNPRWIQQTLSHLLSLHCIYAYPSQQKFQAKPKIYTLDILGRAILKREGKYDMRVLDRLYGDKKRTAQYIAERSDLADLYTYFLSIQKLDQKLVFFTDSNLIKYDYLPKDLCDAYVSQKNDQKIKRYFVSIFDSHTPKGIYRSKVLEYLDYYYMGRWEDGTKNTPFPSILLIFPNERIKKHILHYAKEKVEDRFNIYLTTKDRLYNNDPKISIWQKVE